jgi:hypothetical protein
LTPSDRHSDVGAPFAWSFYLLNNRQPAVGAAVLAFLEGAFWLALILIVLAVLAVVLYVLGAALTAVFSDACSLAFSIARSLSSIARGKPRPPRGTQIDGIQFIDRQDYLDWANREGRWADQSG